MPAKRPAEGWSCSCSSRWNQTCGKHWWAGKGCDKGVRVKVENGPDVEIMEDLEGSESLVRFLQPVEHLLPGIGEMPLPPYIHEKLAEPGRYQTVYASETGSAAAPTAGLHFTPELMEELTASGIHFARVTLHVGLDTFAPVTEEDPQEHQIHTEWCELTPKTAELINQTQEAGGQGDCCGHHQRAHPGKRCSGKPQTRAGGTISADRPGYSSCRDLHFKVVDAMVTNFHLPKSTLLCW